MAYNTNVILENKADGYVCELKDVKTPMTSKNDLIIGGSNGTPARLSMPANSVGKVLGITEDALGRQTFGYIYKSDLPTTGTITYTGSIAIPYPSNNVNITTLIIDVYLSTTLVGSNYVGIHYPPVCVIKPKIFISDYFYLTDKIYLKYIASSNNTVVFSLVDENLNVIPANSNIEINYAWIG